MRQPPSRASLPIADIAGGAFAAIAILAALHEGKGRTLDLSLYESVLYSSALRFGMNAPADSVDHLYPANDLFECGDGKRLALTIVEEKFWHNLVAATRDIAPELGSKAYETEAGRLENYENLMGQLDSMFATRPASDWISLFDPADVPAAICLTNAEAEETPQARARGMHRQTSHGTVVPFPVLADGKLVPAHGPAPEPSADADDILSQLGFDASEIAALKDSGTVPVA